MESDKRREMVNKIESILCCCLMAEDGERNPCPTCQYYAEEKEKLADFILEQQSLAVKGVCEPLKNHKELISNQDGWNEKWGCYKAIDQALSKARGYTEGT